MTDPIAFRSTIDNQEDTWGVHVRAWYPEPSPENPTKERAEELARESCRDTVAALERAMALFKRNAVALETATSLEVEIFRPSRDVGDWADFELTDSAHEEAKRLLPHVADAGRAAKYMAQHAVFYEGDGVNCRFSNWAMWVDGNTICTIRTLEL